MSYCGYITKIREIRKHSNADRLQIATVFGNDVVVGLDTKEGDIVVYFPTDGKLGIEFAKENGLLRKDEHGNPLGGYLDYDKRHVTTIKLRGERSDGLICPIESLSKFTDIGKLQEGDMITTLNGVLICEKYIPKKKASNPNPSQKAKKKVDTVSFPFFEEHIDTSQLPYNLGKFKEGDTCYITLKLHGTSQRMSFSVKNYKTKLQLLLNKVGVKTKSKTAWEYVTGTRRVVLKDFQGGFYGGNEFRKQWHDFFVGKLHKGESVYFEVVGWVNEDSTIMPSCDNSKTKDKEFIKQYGEKTVFTYGCDKGQSDIYVYRMTKTDEDGRVVEYPTELVQLRCEQMGIKFVPILDKFIFTSQEDLMERVKKHEDGADPIGKVHIREGVIVRIDNREKFTAFKQKSFDFKVLEGIVKADDVLDIEEAEGVVNE